MITKNNSILSVILNIISSLLLIITLLILLSNIGWHDSKDTISVLIIFITVLCVFIHSIKCIKTKSEIVYRQNIVKSLLLVSVLIPIDGLVMGVNKYGFDIEPLLLMSVISLSWTIPLLILNIRKLKDVVLMDLKNKYNNTMEIR